MSLSPPGSHDRPIAASVPLRRHAMRSRSYHRTHQTLTTASQMMKAWIMTPPAPYFTRNAVRMDAMKTLTACRAYRGPGAGPYRSQAREADARSTRPAHPRKRPSSMEGRPEQHRSGRGCGGV